MTNIVQFPVKGAGALKVLQDFLEHARTGAITELVLVARNDADRGQLHIAITDGIDMRDLLLTAHICSYNAHRLLDAQR